MMQHIPRMSPVLHNRASQALNVMSNAHHRWFKSSGWQVHVRHTEDVLQHMQCPGAVCNTAAPSRGITCTKCEAQCASLKYNNIHMQHDLDLRSHLNSGASSLPKAAPKLSCQAL